MQVHFICAQAHTYIYTHTQLVLLHVFVVSKKSSLFTKPLPHKMLVSSCFEAWKSNECTSLSLPVVGHAHLSNLFIYPFFFKVRLFVTSSALILQLIAVSLNIMVAVQPYLWWYSCSVAFLLHICLTHF